MIVIRFGRWSHCAKRMFTYTRIYFRGYIWTPFCKMRKRYGKLFKDFEDTLW